MEFGPFRLDPSAKSLYLNGEFMPLTPKSAALLCLLVEEPGRLVTKDEILQRVWKDAYVEEGSISNNVWALRKILNPHFEGEVPIATVARRGYRFTAPVAPSARLAPNTPLARRAHGARGAQSTSGAQSASVQTASVPSAFDATDLVASTDRLLASSRTAAIAASVLVILAAVVIATVF